MHNALEDFKSRFVFKPEISWQVGVESECFIANEHNMPVPRAPEIVPELQRIYGKESFTYELSACQVELRTPPSELRFLHTELQCLQYGLNRLLRKKGLQALHTPVGPSDMPLDVYPDERYQNITQHMDTEHLRAACRIIATHLHIGMPDHETALRVYNGCRAHMPGLCLLGDKSNGERLRIYRSFTPSFDPPRFERWNDLYLFASEHGLTKDVRKWWSGIRISRHGTIEFRMFDATASINDIVKWARTVRAICKGYAINAAGEGPCPSPAFHITTRSPSARATVNTYSSLKKVSSQKNHCARKKATGAPIR